MKLLCQKVDYEFENHGFPQTPVQEGHAIDLFGTVHTYLGMFCETAHNYLQMRA